ncbi:MAG: ABC transporter ATP-binding protein [Candidatus Omnitrophota bacterium]
MEILKADNVSKYFKHRKKTVRALDGVDVFVKEKGVTALVGESGCGKTTLAKCILGFYPLDSGNVSFSGKDITNPRKNKEVLRKNIQIVFQNPFLSLDPRYTVFSTLYETFSVFNSLPKKQAYDIVIKSLIAVGLDETFLGRYPHQISGGEQQRVSIARALINKPKVVILDEPTSSLDVSTTVKIIELLKALQEESSLSYLFISHNLGLVKRIADYVFVMYYGKIVECGTKEKLYHNPSHPYTELLLRASRYKVKDDAAPLETGLAGCILRNRCPKQDGLCEFEPKKVQIEPDHFVFCHKI